MDRLRATPPVLAKGRSKAVSGHFDTVLVRLADGDENQHTKGTCLEGACFIQLFIGIVSNEFAVGLRVAQLRVIFSLPEHLHHSCLPTQLAYIEWFTPFRAPHADSGLFSLTRTTRNNGPLTEVIPLNSIVSSCHLIPRFGTKYYPTKWDSNTVLEECKSFFLNKYIHIRTFFDLEHHLHV